MNRIDKISDVCFNDKIFCLVIIYCVDNGYFIFNRLVKIRSV